MDTQFPNNLKKLMLREGIKSNRQLSRMAGIADTTIGMYLSGKVYPQKASIKSLCKALKCSESELMGYSDGAASRVEYSSVLLNSMTTDTIRTYKGSFGYAVPDHIQESYGSNGYTDKMDSDSVNKFIPIDSHLYYISEDNPKAYTGHICAILHNSEIIYRRVFFTAYSVVLEPDTYTEGYESILYDIDSTDYEILGRVVWFEHMEEGL